MNRENSKVLIFFLSGVICFLVAFILIQSIRTDVSVEKGSFEKISISEKQSDLKTETPEKVTGFVVVYITGAVKSPGIVKLPVNTRVYDAVEKAGGFSENADKEAMNLSRIVADGEHIHIGETKKNTYTKNVTSSSLEVGDYVNKANSERSLLVNINTAGLSELDLLPGVGVKTAEKIIAYRSINGRFRKIDEIMKVNGIGPKKFEKMKGHITIGN